MNHSSASYQVWHLAGITFVPACPSWTVDMSKFNVECCDEENVFFLFMKFLAYDSIIYFVLLQKVQFLQMCLKSGKGNQAMEH